MDFMDDELRQLLEETERVKEAAAKAKRDKERLQKQLQEKEKRQKSAQLARAKEEARERLKKLREEVDVNTKHAKHIQQQLSSSDEVGVRWECDAN